ncbi:hypothetical protein [Arenibaculum pallidiluteum]|uniref:hypothetical protein n=1 Tax=Arenibaculum pallidiluteum TaxID=2812559 RepID=UPI001A977FB0|nr:hypothetical protein [Arenibaculum pallidiluteum]
MLEAAMVNGKAPVAELFGRTYSFADLVPLYGRVFATDLARAWQQHCALHGRQVTEKRLAAVKRILNWLAAQDLEHPGSAAGQAFRDLRDGRGRLIDPVDWRDTVNAFCDRLRDTSCTEVIESPNVLTRRSIIHFLSAGLRALADEGLMPHVGPLRSFGKGKLSGGNIPSLAELTPGRRGRQTFPTPLPNKSINELAELNRKRLAALRGCAVRQLVDEYQVFKRGQELMARDDLPEPADFETALATRKLAKLIQILPRDTDGQLGGLLRFVKTRRDNCLFVRIEKYPMQQLVARLGGATNVVRHLESTVTALLAAYTIAMIDTGFDIGACDDLAANPFAGSVNRGRQRVTTVSAIKLRAGGKIAEATLVEGEADLMVKVPGQDVSGVAAIKMWQEMVAPLRERAERAANPAAGKLWLMAGDSLNQGPIRVCDPVAFKGEWNRFLKRIEDDKVIGGLPIQRRMIRPTVLQVLSADNDFDHTLAQAKANHSGSGMTMRYLSAPWFRAELARRIREFQVLYEAAALGEIQDVASKLGISAAALERRQRTALDTGLGFICLDPTQGIQPGVSPGEQCLQVDACATCSLRRFVPTDEGLVSLVLFNRAIKSQEESFRSRNPERWEAVWLPYLALTEAIIGKLMDGPYRVKFRRAEAEAMKRTVERTAAMIRIW